MGFEKFDAMVDLGKDLRKSYASSLDMKLIKLTTAIALNPDSHLSFAFFNEDGNKPEVVFYDNTPNGYTGFETVTVPLGANVVSSALALSRAENAIFEYLADTGELNHEPILSNGDRILWSALDGMARARANHKSGFGQTSFDRIRESVDKLRFQLNTYRKLFKCNYGFQKRNSKRTCAGIEGTMSMIISALNYFKGSDGDEQYLRTSVNDRTYFERLADLDALDRIIRANTDITYGELNDVDYLCCITNKEDKVSNDIGLAILPFCDNMSSQAIDADYKLSTNDYGYSIKTKLKEIEIPIDIDVYTISKVRNSDLPDSEKDRFIKFIADNFGYTADQLPGVKSLNRTQLHPNGRFPEIFGEPQFGMIRRFPDYEKIPQVLDKNGGQDDKNGGRDDKNGDRDDKNM